MPQLGQLGQARDRVRAAHLTQGDDTENADRQERPQAGCCITGPCQRRPKVVGEPVKQRGKGSVPSSADLPGVVDLDAPGGHAQTVDDRGGYECPTLLTPSWRLHSGFASRVIAPSGSLYWS
jgi:hypothetical protein